MTPHALAIAAFHDVEEALSAELARTSAQRESLRKLDAPKLFDWAKDREAFDQKLSGLTARAKALLSQAEPKTPELTAAVEKAQRAAAILRAADELDRGIFERSLGAVRTLSSRLSVRGAAYGRRGGAPVPTTTTTTSRTA